MYVEQMAKSSAASLVEPTSMVRMRGVAKYFPGVIANEDVDFDLVPGEIHALLGENGAGKSTLMNVLTGIYKPDAGDILIGDKPVNFGSPAEAIASGIGMVHQHFRLVKAFTVAENIHLGWQDTPFQVKKAELESRTAQLAKEMDLEVDPGATVGDLSTGEQQRVEILRVLARQARVLILDEPTAVLTPAEAKKLFFALRAFVARGNAVIFISHKLDEVLEISDRISVLRGGRKVATEKAEDCDKRSLARLMVGQEVVLGNLRKRGEGAAPISSTPVIQLENVSAEDSYGNVALKNISLELRGGEVLGIAGVAGNGQRELSEVLTGICRSTSGRIEVQGREVGSSNAGRFTSEGVGHIPEDRLRCGLAPDLSVADNVILREFNSAPLSKGWMFRPWEARKLAKTIAEAASVRIPDFGMPVRNLSGGNQQRLVARREMRIAKNALVAAYPCRGLDVGAIDAMLNYFAELRDNGVGVLFISEELEELMTLSDRIAVMFHGEIMGVLDVEDADIETIGLMMGGQRYSSLSVVKE